MRDSARPSTLHHAVAGGTNVSENINIYFRFHRWTDQLSPMARSSDGG